MDIIESTILHSPRNSVTKNTYLYIELQIYVTQLLKNMHNYSI